MLSPFYQSETLFYKLVIFAVLSILLASFPIISSCGKCTFFLFGSLQGACATFDAVADVETAGLKQA